MYLIGLTGNIATGKSTVRESLQTRGIPTIDADALAHAVVLRGRPAWYATVEQFGPSILRPNGEIDRRELGRLVFGNPARLQQLEAILHPAVGTELVLLLRELRAPVAVVEAVKLVESELFGLCDSLWVVTCDRPTQKRRLMEQRRMTEAEAEARLNAQPPVEEKLKLANVVIDNSGTRGETERQVERALEKIDPAQEKPKAAAYAHLLGFDAITAAPPAVVPPAPPAAAVRELKRPTPAPSGKVEVRRAKRSDVDVLGALLAQVEGRPNPLSHSDTLLHFGRWAYWFAERDGRPRGMVAWQAENLVGIVRDFWFEQGVDAPRLMPLLLDGIEQEAISLQCEVLVLVVPAEAEAAMASIVRARGYLPKDLAELHRVWREIAQEHVRANERPYVKRLKEELVTRPI